MDPLYFSRICRTCHIFDFDGQLKNFLIMSSDELRMAKLLIAKLQHQNQVLEAELIRLQNDNVEMRKVILDRDFHEK